MEKQIRSLKIYVALLTIAVLALLAFNIIQLNRSGNFKEINTERINIVESNGTLRLAISNRQRQDPGSYGGKKIANRDRPAGLIFFNDDGDECGGLVYDGDKHSAGMVYSVDQYRNDQIMQLQYSQESPDANTASTSINGTTTKDTNTTPNNAAGTPPQNTSPTNNLHRSYGLKLWDRDDRFPTTRLMTYIDSLNSLHNKDAYKAGIEKIRAEGWLGRERLFVGKDHNGEYGLFLRDTAGRPRLKIYIDNNGNPVIQALDENGAPTQLSK